MPQLNFAALKVTVGLIACSMLLTPGCVAEAEGSAEPSWAAYDLFEGQPATSLAPRRLMRVQFTNESFAVAGRGGVSTVLHVLPPASFLWHPEGTAIAINNGNGSGQISRLTVLIDGEPLRRVEGLERDLTAFYLHETGCSINPEDISLEAEGWAPKGLQLWVRFENWSGNTLCGDDGAHHALFDISRRRVIEHLSDNELTARFCHQPSFRQRFARNCRR